jgi:phosphoribosylaminoimidazole-succinocarboxamide synthase
VLNQTAAWWFDQTRHIVPNALLATPDPNVAVMKKCSVFPVEFVVRGFMTGAGRVFAWGGTGWDGGSWDGAGVAKASCAAGTARRASSLEHF